MFFLPVLRVRGPGSPHAISEDNNDYDNNYDNIVHTMAFKTINHLFKSRLVGRKESGIHDTNKDGPLLLSPCAGICVVLSDSCLLLGHHREGLESQ